MFNLITSHCLVTGNAAINCWILPALMFRYFQPCQFPNIQQYVMVVLHNIHIYIHTYIVRFPLPSVDNQSLQNNFSSCLIMRSRPRLPDSSHLFGRCPTSNCSDRSQWGIAIKQLCCCGQAKVSLVSAAGEKFCKAGDSLYFDWCKHLHIWWCTLVLQNQSFKLCNFT